jgi:hypothetical protein
VHVQIWQLQPPNKTQLLFVASFFSDTTKKFHTLLRNGDVLNKNCWAKIINEKEAQKNSIDGPFDQNAKTQLGFAEVPSARIAGMAASRWGFRIGQPRQPSSAAIHTRAIKFGG